MAKTVFNIDCENFDFFFSNQVEEIHPKAKEGLPKDILFKLFRKGGAFNSTSTSKLGILAKLFILWKCLNKRIWIVVEDERKGLNVAQFDELHKAFKQRDYSVPHAEGLAASATFILASKELSETFHYLNRLSVSPAYNFISKAKNKIPNKTAEWNEQIKYITRFLAHYESLKKVWVSGAAVSIPEWLVLIALFNGKEICGSVLYHETYKRAYQSSPGKIKLAFGTLQHKGYIEKTGIGKGATLRITALGKSAVCDILDKYALNC
jgi:hypothetical protein